MFEKQSESCGRLRLQVHHLPLMAELVRRQIKLELIKGNPSTAHRDLLTIRDGASWAPCVSELQEERTSLRREIRYVAACIGHSEPVV